MKKGRDLTGERFGRWTVLEKEEGKGAAKWLCRCSCGTQRAVAAKNLLAGVSTSCGCLTKERTARVDLSGQRFGRLTVVGRSEQDGEKWRCLCECGRQCDVLQSSLRSGKRTSCGCDSKKGRHRVKDISGERFHMLTALYPTQRREGNNGSVIWYCRCDCGNETEVSLDRLMRGAVVSCGCMQRKNRSNFGSALTHVAGTSIDAIRSGSLRSDNTTGVRGVCRRKGRFEVNITFQRKMYYLGSYSDLETAARVRAEAEELLHGGAVRFYEKWNERAKRDPKWAEENPVRITVHRLANGSFSVEMLPQMDESAQRERELIGR